MNNFKIPHFLVFLIILSTSCASEYLEVEFMSSTVPVDKLKELKVFGFAKPLGLSQGHKKYFLQKLKNCPQYEEVRELQARLNLSFKNPNTLQQSLKATTKIPQVAKVNGFVDIQVKKDSQNSKLTPERLVKLYDLGGFRWVDGQGVPAKPHFGFHGVTEIGYRTRSKLASVYERHNQFKLNLLFVMYNRVLKKIILTKNFQIRASLNTYSKSAAISKEQIRDSLTKSMLDQVSFFACPSLGEVERKLFYDHSEQADQKINQGIEDADDERWDLAASKWNDVLSKKKNQKHALHNLGVYYEKMGNIPEAAKHYNKIVSPSREGIGGSFFELLNRFQSPLSKRKLFPTIIGVSGGNWIYIDGRATRLRIGRLYSVFMLRKKFHPDENSLTDVDLTEVGKIRVTGKRGSVYIGRVVEYLEHYTVSEGQFLAEAKSSKKK